MMTTNNTEALLSLRESDEVYTIEASFSESAAVMNAGRAPFDDIRVRQAATYAMPQEAYLTLIDGGITTSADSVFNPDQAYNNPDVVQITDMPDLAAPLIESYCQDVPDSCTDGKVNFELQQIGPSVLKSRISDLLIDAYEDYFNVTVEELLADAFNVQLALGQYDMAVASAFGLPEPGLDAVYFLCRFISLISLNVMQHCDEERDELIYAIWASTDPDERAEMWKRVQEINHDSYSVVYLAHEVSTVAARNNVHNVCGLTTPFRNEALMCNNWAVAIPLQAWLS